jgi:quercetin dioxygenase-like cupin family protein
MEAKFNEATNNRPEGDRIIDAPFVFTDIEKYHRQLLEEEAWQKNDRNGITVFKTTGCTIVLTALHAAAEVPENEVKGITSIQLLQGKINVRINGENIPLKAMEIISIHAGIPHGISAEDDSLVLITTIL